MSNHCQEGNHYVEYDDPKINDCDDCVYLIEEKQLHVKNSTIVSRNLGRYLIKKSNKAHKYVLPLASRDERHND